MSWNLPSGHEEQDIFIFHSLDDWTEIPREFEKQLQQEWTRKATNTQGTQRLYIYLFHFIHYYIICSPELATFPVSKSTARSYQSSELNPFRGPVLPAFESILPAGLGGSVLFSISVEESTRTSKGRTKNIQKQMNWKVLVRHTVAPPLQKKKKRKKIYTVLGNILSRLSLSMPELTSITTVWWTGLFCVFSSFFTQDPSKYCKHLQAIYAAIEWLVPAKCAKDQLATSLPNGASPSVCNSCTHYGMWNHVEAVCQYAHAEKSWDPAFFHRQCRACQFFKELSIALQGQWYFELMTSLTMGSFDN